MNKQKKTPRVAVGMSGGVDSSLAAVLLVEKGFDVTGVHLVCWEEPGCRAPEDRKDALAVAMQLGIPFEVLDYQKEYKKKVIDYFYREYEAGRTPNPDVVCNREIKFGLFLDWALKNKFDYVATGHYARIKNGGGYRLLQGVDPVKDPRKDFSTSSVSPSDSENQRGKQSYHLLRGTDEKKDQSYFLYILTQEQLKYILFPIGNLTKGEVRHEAKKRELPVADKPDSVGICFVGDVDVQEFLRRRIPEKRGEVVDKEGNVIGEHKGVWFYTIGQRHGFKLSNKLQVTGGKYRHAIPPLYIVSKDVVRNRLVVGFGPETYVNKFQVKDLHFVNGLTTRALASSFDLLVRVRHGGELIPGELKTQNEQLVVSLVEPQRGIAPGQAAVFYKGSECLGGGVIAE